MRNEIARSSALGLSLFLWGCFDPDPPSSDDGGATAVDETGDSNGNTTGGVCEPGVSQSCPCEDGSAGTHVCRADGTGFGACQCDGVDGSGTDDPRECEEDAECAAMAEGECEQGVCAANGTCSVEPLEAGTPCGDPSETECTAADACDGAGTCAPNHMADGLSCADCSLGTCSCVSGVCGDCVDFAQGNSFITERSIQGWELTGDWGLYREAPQTTQNPPVVFGKQVFGTDGNRTYPYPGSEVEASYARTSPMVLPSTIEFESWHLDEGGSGGVWDTKQIRVSVNGGTTWTFLADCLLAPDDPFCEEVFEREPDDWDSISLPVPAAMVGEVGIIEFIYDTGDECCGFEQGWYIDVTNLATQCACVSDESCSGLGGECGAAVCGATGECELEPVELGAACGDSTEVECSAADTCDGAGYCAQNWEPNGFDVCTDCAEGPGGCNTCQQGACIDCMSMPNVNDFNGSLPTLGWVIEDIGGTGADWRLYWSAPQNHNSGSVSLSTGPAFGTDGNRVTPYPGNEMEHSRVTTTLDILPTNLTFASWHVDEGGQGGLDDKIIEVSTDEGMTWTVLVQCSPSSSLAFCQSRSDTRAGGDWDNISIPMGGFAGQVGQLRFTYDTGDGCCGFERGWFIDNLNFAQYCSDPKFP
jgi:hypothetical protein